MEWVETTGKSIDEARNAALDQLGVAADDAEFEVLDEPRQGLFGRVRGQARVRARVRPTPVRPKQDRRRRGRDGRSRRGPARDTESTSSSDVAAPADTADGASNGAGEGAADETPPAPRRAKKTTVTKNPSEQENAAMSDQTDDVPSEPSVSPQEVGDAAVRFVDGLTDAFGLDGRAALTVDGSELDVSVSGSELGLLVGSGGRTLNAIQDLARVASQRRLGDHDTRLRVDVSGYRARREAALARFAHDIAEQVRTTGTARSLEPMVSADRKIVHDVLNDEDGVASRSEGDEPSRRIIVEPA